MGLGEADARAKLIDPAIHARGWTEDLIRREETAGAIEIVDGKPRKRAKGRVDYTLRVKVNLDTQPVVLALIEAKAEDLPPMHGLEQGKLYASCKRLDVPFVFSSNGHLFVEFDRLTGHTSAPKPLAVSRRLLTSAFAMNTGWDSRSTVRRRVRCSHATPAAKRRDDITKTRPSAPSWRNLRAVTRKRS